MKNKPNFSSSVGASLNGRNEASPDNKTPTKRTVTSAKPVTPKPKPKKKEPEPTPETDKKGNIDRGYGLNQDGTFRQSRAGRKTAEEKQQPKRSQVALTLDAATIEKLSDLGNGYKKLLNRYLDKNIDEIIDELKKL